ncbi:MAG: HAD-IA family hydrolase [Desulfobulbaceae bacterium]|jgi:phosphoglycolate phosphatase|nr:HAD-IA family hydrolase [Desulfobulbaceae bacterium]
MRYSAVLFDLDGTLLDSLEDLATTANRMLAVRNLPMHPVDAYRYFVGDGVGTLVERILPEALRFPAAIEEAVVAFQEEYARNWHERTCPYPGIAGMLDGLVAGGLRLSILSNKPDAFTQLCVQRLLPQWSFEPLLGQRQGVPKKPDPAAALEIAARLGLTPAEILYVGDTAVDMQTALAAGMDAVGVLWGFRTAEELRAAGAHHLIARPEHLLPIVFLL